MRGAFAISNPIPRMSDLLLPPGVQAATSRRGFFQRFGAGTAAFAVVASGCDSNEDDDPDADAVTISFADDFGVLNYAYALEQLEYGFYQQVTQGGYFRSLATSSEERQILQDLRDHELAHVDFFNAALGTNAIGELTPDFDAIDFDDRTSVLTTARTFEDVGVSAYNGAGQYFINPDFLTIAGKIVSVEARHAAAIRSILAPTDRRAFAGNDVVDPTTGLDVVRTPAQVLTAVQPFVANRLSFTNVPS